MTPAPPFDCHHAGALGSPVVISVPHAGRDYGTATTLLRVPARRAQMLEDRYADLLAKAAIARGFTTIIARTPRLIIDLNRGEDELDHRMVRGGKDHGTPLSARTRGGLGLIPSRLATLGELWRAPLDPAEVARRIEGVHRAYHRAVARALSDSVARFGSAVLIDLHSMPPIAGPDAPDMVIGDRFGTAASRQTTDLVSAVCARHGLRTALNVPYAGGHIVTRHGHPARGVHAFQIEVDRRLYLDAGREAPGPGLTRMQTVIADIASALSDMIAPPFAAAAE